MGGKTKANKVNLVIRSCIISIRREKWN